MNLPKMPSAFMQGLIAVLLLLNFTFMLLAPSIFTNYQPPAEALTQTLVNLVILAVGYYLGSSSGSARKDEINVQQQDKAIAALAPPPDPPPVVVAPGAESVSINAVGGEGVSGEQPARVRGELMRFKSR